MEMINYSNIKSDEHIYGKNKIVGLIDKSGGFLENNYKDMKSPVLSKNIPVGFYLRILNRDKKKALSMTKELEITKEIERKPLKKLSSSEIIKILVIVVVTGKANTIVLDSIDTYLNDHDLANLFKTVKTNIKGTDKTVIFKTNKVDNIMYTDRYVITNDLSIIYNGCDFKKLPIETETVEFTNLAKKKGAKLDYYKETSDLLKAIYRSVK